MGRVKKPGAGDRRFAGSRENGIFRAQSKNNRKKRREKTTFELREKTGAVKRVITRPGKCNCADGKGKKRKGK